MVSLTVRPCVDRMGAVAHDRCVQVFPQYIDFVLHVDEEHIRVAAGTPRVAAHACVAVVPVERLLLGPGIVAVGPAHGVERGGVAGVPEVDADGLIGTVPGTAGGLPGNGRVVIGGVAVETAVPAGLEADVGVVHGLQVEGVDRSLPPDVGGVVVDHFGDGVVDVDVEYMPLISVLVGEFDFPSSSVDLRQRFGSWRRLPRLLGFRFWHRRRQY